MVPAIDATQKKHIEAVADLIKHEVNVKDLTFVEGQGILVKKVKCNFRVMGKKFGKLMKQVAAPYGCSFTGRDCCIGSCRRIQLRVKKVSQSR